MSDFDGVNGVSGSYNPNFHTYATSNYSVDSFNNGFMNYTTANNNTCTSQELALII